jgi:hypothetical protein
VLESQLHLLLCVIFILLLVHTKLQFLPLQNGDSTSIYFRGSWC